MSRPSSIVVWGALLVGCAPSAGPATPTPAGPSRAPSLESHGAPRIQRIADPETGLEQILLLPVNVETEDGEALGPSRIAVGALFVTRGDGMGGVALLVRTLCPRPLPLLAFSRRLDLVVDGRLLEGDPHPDPRLYRVDRTPIGTVETLIVPVGPGFLGRLAEATEVRGMLAGRYGFAIPAGQRQGFAMLLAAVAPKTVRLPRERIGDPD